MAYVSHRDIHDAHIRDGLRSWLPSRIAPGAVTSFEISELTAPSGGFSGKTVFFTVSWADSAGRWHSDDLVLRIQANDHQLFTTPDAPRQAEVMRRLGQHGVPVPHIVGVEYDKTVFGASCYVMKRVNGRVPPDVPSWHKRGWTADLSASQRELLCDNALRALVEVHRIDDPEDLRFLRAGPDTGATGATTICVSAPIR
jgi:aminoglycoside phosphotransferase (APT) family kinase protein